MDELLVLDQGLIFPNNCTPYLIAMTTDPEKSIQSKALTHLTNLSKSCPNLLRSNSISGVRLSFMLQKLIKSSEAAKSAPGDPDTAKYAHVVRGYIENTDILSLNHHLYALLRVNRSYRRIFAQQLVFVVALSKCFVMSVSTSLTSSIKICVKILRRINDEDSIKKLVIDHFYSIWFSPISSSSSNQETLLKRVLNLVDVVSELNVVASNQASIEIFEQLFNALLTVNKPNNSGTMIITDENIKLQQNQQNSTPLTNEQESQISRAKEVLKSCKQIVDCLIKNVLNTEANIASPQAYKRLVASFTTLFLLSKIKPENLVDHSDTLLPYLKRPGS